MTGFKNTFVTQGMMCRLQHHKNAPVGRKCTVEVLGFVGSVDADVRIICVGKTNAGYAPDTRLRVFVGWLEGVDQ